MDLTGKLKQGMRVVGADDAEYGTVERYDDAGVYVGGRPIPYGAFERVEQGRLYIRADGARFFEADDGARAVIEESEVRVPLREERIAIGTRTTEVGAVEVRTSVTSGDVSVPIELRRDQVEVRLIDVDARPITIGEGMDAFTVDMIRVPVRGEEVAVEKQAVVTGEVSVGRTEVSEQRTISETVRQEVVDVTVTYDEARPEFRRHFDRLQARLREVGGPTFRAHDFADAEPLYRVGFEARNDPRHADRSFEEVEAELRERQVSPDAAGAESGDMRREALRVGWERARRPVAGMSSASVPIGAEPDAVRDAPLAPSGAEPDGGLGEPGEILRVPEVEEHLRVERRRVALGFIEVRKTVVTERVMVPVELRREVVEYRLIDDPGGVATVGEAPGDLRDDTVRIPVFREQPVIQKEVVVTSEVVIDRRLSTERRTLDETLRRATVTVEGDVAPPASAQRRAPPR
jgi:uncharacterized protein (TIGR02271 family)